MFKMIVMTLLLFAAFFLTGIFLGITAELMLIAGVWAGMLIMIYV